MEEGEPSDDSQDVMTSRMLDMELLRDIYQRHHDIFQSTVMEIRSSLDSDDDQERLEQFIMALSLVSMHVILLMLIVFGPTAYRNH